MTPTIARKLASNRSRQLRANASLPAAWARPIVVASFRPRFRIVSIIPGIEIGAPDRTLTRSGSDGSPKWRPTAASIPAIRTRSSSSRPAGQPLARKLRQVAVVITKPGGTGRPSSRDITPRLAALPPTSALTSASVPECGASRAKVDVTGSSPRRRIPGRAEGSLSARQTRSGVRGRSRMTAPVASWTAAATAGATQRRAPSLIPFEPYGPGPSSFSTMSLSMRSGRSMLVGIR